jgi:hypothetical protein
LGLKSFAEIFAVIDATVEDQAHHAALVAQGLALLESLWRCPEHAVAETN